MAENNDLSEAEAEIIHMDKIIKAHAYKETAKELRESSRRFLGLFLKLEEELKGVAQLLVDAADALDPPENNDTNEGDTNVN